MNVQMFLSESFTNSFDCEQGNDHLGAFITVSVTIKQ